MPLPTTMMWRLRVARRAQLILWIAALLSVGGSFGLHPEPGDAAMRSASVVESDGSPELRRVASSRHPCVACLSQRPHSLVSVIDAPSARLRIVPFAPPPALHFAQRLDTANHEGRAPPTVS
jgi:hypothetical protein